MEFQDGDFRVGKRMEGIDILRDHRAEIPLLPQILDRPMRVIWLGLLKPRPPNKAPRPVSLAGFMPRQEFMKVYWSIGFVRDIRAVLASIVGQTGRHRDSGTS